MRQLRVHFIGLVCLFVLFQSIHAEKIEFDDLYSYSMVSSPRFSPDGKQIIFTIKIYDLKSNSAEKYIWKMNSNGFRHSQLVFQPASEWNPIMTLNNKQIIYESDHDSSDQIHLWDIKTKLTKNLTSLTTGASGAILSPKGDKLLFVSESYPGCTTDSCNKIRKDEEDSNPIKAKLYDKLMFRHYKYWDNDWADQLFIYDIKSDSLYQLTNEIHGAPTSTLGGHQDYAFSEDGSEVCFVANRDSMLTLSTNNDLFVVPTTGGEPVKITGNKGQDHSPRYSPDGKYISYRSQAQAGYESDQYELKLYDRKSGEITDLTAGFDYSIGGYLWGPKSKYIYFTAIKNGLSMLWRLKIKDKEVENLLSDAVYSDFDLSPNGKKIVLLRSLSDEPDEVYLFTIKSKELERLTYFTEKMTERLDLYRADSFWFEGFNGDSVQGFLTLPPDFDSTKIYPLTFLIHGGPQWCWLTNFNYYGWNTQLLAAQGYVVAQVNPHGSVGYGQKFKEYISGNWGKGDYEDLMLGVDYLLENYKFIDSTRMAALGRSYGGFMINWINGHTDRFKCMICIDGTFNQISEYGTTDELWFPEWEAKGTPWTNHEEYVRSSPSTYSANMKTPTMFIHGQLDYRVDVSEGFQAFTTLQRMGIPSQLLYFPDEGHSVRKVQNVRHVYEKQFEWLAKWLKE